MDAERFTPNSPGKLVQLAQPRKDWAFIPNELPIDWQFSDALWPLLVEAKESLGTLNGIGQTLPNPELLLRPLQSREAITSSSIEGTYVTPEQLLLYELDPREPKSAGEPMADWREVFNYSRALAHGCELLNTLPICNRVVKEIHGILMQGVRGRNKSPGEFRRWQVQLGSSGRFIPPPPSEVERLMGNLESYANAEDDRYDPLIRAYLIHYQFETIHPFSDGNGRVGRTLLALMIYKWLGHSMPWLYMSSYFERFQDEYVSNLFRISTEGDWISWIQFCLRGTIAQAKDSIRRCHQFNQLRTEFHGRIDSHTPRTHRILDGLFSSPIVTVTSIASKYDITYHTAKSDIQRLVDAGILKPLAKVRPRSFFSSEIMDIAYGEPELEGRPSGAPPTGGADDPSV